MNQHLKPSYVKARAETNRRALLYIGRWFAGALPTEPIRTENELAERAANALRALRTMFDERGPVALRSRHSAEAEVVREEIDLLLMTFDDEGEEADGRQRGS